MKTALALLSFTCSCFCVQAQIQPGRNIGPQTRFVVAGDSLSAGVQNFSLLYSQQPNGFASIIARQAGWPLELPLIPYPGAPNKLELINIGPPPDIQPVTGDLLFPRLNPLVQPTNVSVPGGTVNSALNLRPSLTATDPVQQWTTLVLGFPALLQGKAPTEIEAAIALRPTTVLEWLGNNEALVPSLTGQLSALTPPAQFASDYKLVLDRLSSTGAKIITASVPDVTSIAYFTSARTIALQAHLSLSTITSMLGMGPNDFIRPSAAPFVDAILSGKPSQGLPSACPAPLSSLGVSTVPCILTGSDAAIVRTTIDCYNQTIRSETAAHGGVFVDVNALLKQIYASGYQLGDQTLSTDFFGGLFSLDGVHPSNTGYGIVANYFIATMNAQMGTQIPLADISEIFNADPLAKYVQNTFVPRTAPAGTGACLATAAR